jgi:serine/threonine protein phosphatase PrpC
MSLALKADAPLTGYADFDRLIRRQQDYLTARGSMIVGSGCVRSLGLSASFHTDFGPKDQDKISNQDYVLAWQPHAADNGRQPRLALAMGDGLTTSFRSECGAALACWVALRALVETAATLEPRALAAHGFNEAGSAIGQVADDMARDPQASCPPGQFLSTWKYILRKGALFQTTLTLAWLDRDHLYIAMVGDGGSLWRGCHKSLLRRRSVDRILAQCDLNNNRVYALGPADRCVQEFDCWREEKTDQPFRCALFTDGVGRGLGSTPLTMLDDLDKYHCDGSENTAQRFIEQAIERRPHEFTDNLTLAVIRSE